LLAVLVRDRAAAVELYIMHEKTTEAWNRPYAATARLGDYWRQRRRNRSLWQCVHAVHGKYGV